MTPLDLVVLTLATYYASVTLAKLHGPFGLAEQLRHAVYRRRGFVLARPAALSVRPAGTEDAGSNELTWLRPTDETGIYDTPEADWLAAGFSCPLCLSLYAAAALALLQLLGGAAGQAVVAVLAVAGGASVLFSMGRYW